MSQQPIPDLTHADWWIRTIVKILQQIDSALRFSISTHANDTKHLHIDNISEETLPKLYFLTNTDQNNNYGYLEDFFVYTTNDYSRTPINIPGGFSELAQCLFQNSDAKAFLNGDKTHKPFFQPLINPVTKKPLSMKNYIDMITSTMPWNPQTTGFIQYYSIVVNPDAPGVHPDTIVTRGSNK
jgi:hypothetical protein